MDWRTSDDFKRTQIPVDRHVDAGDARHGSLAVIAGIDLAAGGPRFRLGAALFDDLQVARRSGWRFGAGEDLSE
jgi:hypothetical protein